MVDFIRTAYRTQARLWWDSTETVEIRWFRAPKDAELVPQPNYYVSGVWDDVKSDHYPVLGDAWQGKRPYDKGANPLNYRGKNACGSPLAWQQGGYRSRDEVITTGADGSSDCCADRGFVVAGGVGWGGGINPIPVRPVTGGVLVGGSVLVDVPAAISATGGVLVGGSVLVDVPAAISATGGVLVGGVLSDEATVIEYGTGGVLVGGSVVGLSPGAVSVDGGVLVGGSVVAVAAHEESVTGGVLVGGSVLVTVPASASATGGVLVGGSATVAANAVQTATGGVLVGGSLSQQQGAQFSATGGVLVGGSVVVGVIPVQSVNADEGYVVSGNPVNDQASTNQIGNLESFQNPPAITDVREWKFFLPAGSYNLFFRYIKFAAGGQFTFSIDGTSVSGTFDSYSAATTYNVLSSFGITIATSGLHTLRLAITGKNAASTNYFADLSRFWFQ